MAEFNVGLNGDVVKNTSITNSALSKVENIISSIGANLLSILKNKYFIGLASCVNWFNCYL
jgi:hypothetical protein